MQPLNLDTSELYRWVMKYSLYREDSYLSDYHCGMGKSSKDLTAKQRYFCRLVAAGNLSQAEAYRTAYDCSEGSKNTHVESASRLSRNPDIAAMIRRLIDARDRAQLDRGLSKRDLVISKLSEAIDNDDFGVNRLKALSLMADVLGMKRTGLDVTKEDNRSAEAIAAELDAKLSALGLDETPNTETVMDQEPGMDLDDDIDQDTVIDQDAEARSTRH